MRCDAYAKSEGGKNEERTGIATKREKNNRTAETARTGQVHTKFSIFSDVTVL